MYIMVHVICLYKLFSKQFYVSANFFLFTVLWSVKTVYAYTPILNGLIQLLFIKITLSYMFRLCSTILKLCTVI
jgi:hypothetical protein